MIESIGELKGLENLYFDTGAVTEAGATNALIRAFGPQKVRAIGLSAMRLQFSVPFAFPEKNWVYHSSFQKVVPISPNLL